MKMRVSFVLNNIGDYHAARLAYCAGALVRYDCHLNAIEASGRSSFYHHKQTRSRSLRMEFEHRSLAEEGDTWSVPALWRALGESKPTHIFTVGYSDRLSLAALAYAKLRGIRIFFMADSKADDQTRSAWTERVKGLVVRSFDGALVAGQRHRNYFRSLGCHGPIEIGYDVIDNEFFRDRARKLASKAGLMRKMGVLPQRYILCVSRLVTRKRVDLALEIFAKSGAPERGLCLVLIGAGPLDSQVHRWIQASNLTGKVFHFRNVKNSMMPAFYSNAEALILASDYDQWGLCVNEAMALGVPCFVTDRCGVAGEIVLEEKTGFVFPSGTSEKGAVDLRRLLAEPGLRPSLSLSAAGEIEKWDLGRFANSVMDLIGVERTAINL